MTKTHANPETPRPPRKRVFVTVGAGALALLAWGAWGHLRTDAAAAEAQEQTTDFVPQLRIARALREDGPVKLTLPGQTAAFDVANLFARATGYVAERKVDIGSRVKKGDLLLRIAAPDEDAQLEQAVAQLSQNEAALAQANAALQQAQANVKLANITRFRETTLARQGWETQANADTAETGAQTTAAAVTNAEAGIAVASANVRAQQATVNQLKALTTFEQVVAPFDGVITARHVDTGDLLTANNEGGTALFSIQRDDVLRVDVAVPQSGAVGIRDGLPATVTVPELPGRNFEAHVSRVADALDPASRSMLTEVDVNNPDGALRPGLYVNVTFSIPRQYPGVVVPDEALVFDAQGLHVVTVGADDRVHLQPVSIYRDFGTTAELSEGLLGNEMLVLQPPTDLAEGSKVRTGPLPNPANVAAQTARG